MFGNRGHVAKAPNYLWHIPRLTPYWVALLLTDTRNVLVHDTQGISNLPYVTKEDSKRLERVRIGMVGMGDWRVIVGLTVSHAHGRAERSGGTG